MSRKTALETSKPGPRPIEKTSAANRIFLIDTMSFIFRAYHAMARQRGMSTKTGLPTAATYVFVNMLRKLRDDFSPEYLAAVFDVSAPTFRSQQAKDFIGAGRRRQLALPIRGGSGAQGDAHGCIPTVVPCPARRAHGAGGGRAGAGWALGRARRIGRSRRIGTRRRHRGVSIQQQTGSAAAGRGGSSSSSMTRKQLLQRINALESGRHAHDSEEDSDDASDDDDTAVHTAPVAAKGHRQTRRR